MQIRNRLDMHSIIYEIKHSVLPNESFSYNLRTMGYNVWILRISRPNGNRTAKIEIIVDEYEDEYDRGARGSVLRYGDIPRQHVALILDSIMERI